MFTSYCTYPMSKYLLQHITHKGIKMRNEDIGVVNTGEETEDIPKDGNNMKSGCRCLDIHIKLYFMNLTGNKILVAQGKGGQTT